MPTKDYQPYLIKRLKNPEYAVMYLKAAWNETLEDGDIEAFILALKNVIKAIGFTSKNY